MLVVYAYSVVLSLWCIRQGWTLERVNSQDEMVSRHLGDVRELVEVRLRRSLHPSRDFQEIVEEAMVGKVWSEGMIAADFGNGLVPMLERAEVGWPLRTVRGFRFSDPFRVELKRVDRGVISAHRVYGVFGGTYSRSYWPRIMGYVVYGPIWMNIVIEAVGLWGAWLFGAMLVRGVVVRLRRKQGVCEGCGYSLVGIEEGLACPECGMCRGEEKR